MLSPLDADTVRDPTFATLDDGAKEAKALELQRSRCLRALDHIRRPVCFAVANDFLARGWITGEDLTVIQSGGAFFGKEDSEMNEAAAAFSAETTSPAGAGQPSNSQ